MLNEETKKTDALGELIKSNADLERTKIICGTLDFVIASLKKLKIE